MAKGTIVKKGVVKRQKGYLYYLDREGNLRKKKMNRSGAKKGHKTCSTPKKSAAKKKSAKKKIRKHAGINQKTGRLKKGYKYKNGKVVKAKS